MKIRYTSINIPRKSHQNPLNNPISLHSPQQFTPKQTSLRCKGDALVTFANAASVELAVAWREIIGMFITGDWRILRRIDDWRMEDFTKKTIGKPLGMWIAGMQIGKSPECRPSGLTILSKTSNTSEVRKFASLNASLTRSTMIRIAALQHG